ncbi:low molecular weight protein-tyrosine-phosphatase [Commensalibacter oyaizuii]|uniref:protein-tyrosine-phosphatase n=1 Tax=Commensalibacter oyaizuii TaxID=3043873 RepID=A0ABT6PYJ1_9PROT|nr:low molecular weight protein-tyrosine-phosphatase [Commensalibacter sp. TBRC 16381]MDI2089930.1 low molecular weight protein-tyrosine-phosphatase [Commensalibacter sp. TBRC 16381]
MSFAFSVLFVCLGNICRSPMAEAAFIAEVEKRNLNINVDSAGIGPWHIDNPPDPRTIKEVAKHGIDIRHYLGRQIQPHDFQQFTHIIGMDHKNITALLKMAPSSAKDKICLLMDFVPGQQGTEIADPYYGNQDDFERTWKQVYQGVSHLAVYFEQRL